MSRVRTSAHAPYLAHAMLVLCGGLLLVAVGQPIITDDLWWHLALGRAFAAGGPWLAEDPLLFGAAGPPSPASWLADVALAQVAHDFGFHALRALHALSVAAILVLVWSQLRRASDSRAFASFGTIVFAALASYRLLQLRPELFTIAAALLCYRWLIADTRPPDARRIAAVALLSALWANVHAGFPLGSLLIGAAAGGLLCAAAMRPRTLRAADLQRAARLVAALVVAGLATLANPDGIRAHLAYLAAGRSTPSLERVRDEWAPLQLFALPAPPQPSVTSWVIAWILLLGLGWLIVRWISRPSLRGRLDPAKLAVALLSFALLITAVRFLWLGIFPVLLVGELLRDAGRVRVRRIGAWIGAAACVLAAGYVKLGDTLVMRQSMLTWYWYQRPYAVAKHNAHAIWLLADSGVRGHLYNEYFMGGFVGYWLAPDVRALVNGTLNVPSETLDALGAIARRAGLRDGESFEALLDRLDVDVFLGIRMPEPAIAPASWLPTTSHLEHTPGWVPIYRGMGTALYVRSGERGRENLGRLADYYAAQGVPFDRERGFDVADVIREAPDWAIAHGVVPHGFVRMARETSAGRANTTVRDRVAAVCAVLGLYDSAIAIDRALVRAEPQWPSVRRRLVWSLLRLGRLDEASAAAEGLAALPASPLSTWIVDTARAAPHQEPDQARMAIATLPFLTRGESDAVQFGLEPPDPRPAL